MLLAAGLGLVSGGTLLARQDPPPQQPAKPAEPPDMFKFATSSPVLIISQVKPAKVADFEAAWATLRELFPKADRPEVKELGATMEKFYKVELAGAPPIYVHQVDAPKTDFSYHPGKIIYEALYYQTKEGKEMGIPRAQADELWTKLKDCYDNLSAWPLKKM
jgi:hypothetical protein